MTDIYNFWLKMYWVYVAINIIYIVWIIYEPTIWKGIAGIIMVGFLIFNTTQRKKIKEARSREIKEDILEALK